MKLLLYMLTTERPTIMIIFKYTNYPFCEDDLTNENDLNYILIWIVLITFTYH